MVFSRDSGLSIVRSRMAVVIGVSLCQFLVGSWFLGARVYGEDLTREFLDQAPRAWDEYRKYAGELQGSFTRKITKGGKVSSHDRLRFKHNHRCQLVRYESMLSGKANQGVEAFNPLYTFVLKRKNATAPWVATAIVRRADEQAATAVAEIEGARYQLSMLIYTYMSDLPALVKQPTFRVIRASRVKLGGADAVRIEFDNVHKVSNKSADFFPIQSGSITLDPKRSWCLRECDVKTKHPNAEARIKVRNEFSSSPSKYPLPKRRIETQDIDVNGAGKIHMQWEFTFDYSKASVLPPDKEFTLSEFGLPEPFGMETRATPWYLWAAGAGILCVFLGAGFCWLRRRAEVK